MANRPHSVHNGACQASDHARRIGLCRRRALFHTILRDRRLALAPPRELMSKSILDPTAEVSFVVEPLRVIAMIDRFRRQVLKDSCDEFPEALSSRL